MNKLFTLVLIALVLIVAYAFYTAVDVFAMEVTGSAASDFTPTHETANPCIPYVHAMVLKGQGNFSHTITLTHGDCNGNSITSKAQDNTVSNDVPAVVTNSIVVTVDAPTVVHVPAADNTPAVKEHKPKCNNGEGNGSEGCSPARSSHANNDENNTTPKEDKAHK